MADEPIDIRTRINAKEEPITDVDLEALLGQGINMKEALGRDSSLDLEQKRAQMDAKYAYIDDYFGDSAYMTETNDVEGRLQRRFLSKDHFRQETAPITFSDRGKDYPVCEAWMKWPRRRTYKGVCFKPGAPKIVDGYLNEWTGFGVEPKKGCWKRMMKHLYIIMCNSDPVKFRYVVRWFARMVQHPDQAAGTALIFKGKQGCGKGTALRPFQVIFGKHALHVASMDRITGRFNSHMSSRVFLFADEISIQKRDIGVFNTLVTEPTIPVEPKGREVRDMPNCLHIVIATNAEWAAPISGDTRRFFINEADPRYSSEVGHLRHKSNEYFTALDKELKEGGAAAMLHDLLQVNLEGFNVFNVPKTTELYKHRANTLDVVGEAVRDLLYSGDCPGEEVQGDKIVCKGENLISYLRQTHPKSKDISERSFFTELSKYGIGTKVFKINKKPERRIHFPSLIGCREKWCDEHKTQMSIAFPESECPREWIVNGRVSGNPPEF